MCCCASYILLLYRLRSNCPARGGNERPPSLDFISSVVAISLDTMELLLLHSVWHFSSRIARLHRVQLDHIRSTGRSESLALPRRPPHKSLASLDFDNSTVGWTTGMFFSLIRDSFGGHFVLSKIGVSFGILNGAYKIVHRETRGPFIHCL